MKDSIIIIPYANIDAMRGGVNVSDEKRFDIYMKNCCVALISAKQNNPTSDVALVTNVKVPEEYSNILDLQGILIINAEFNAFRFPDDYKWGLAFYKLCALKYVVDHYSYEYYSYLDSDVYIQSGFENIWVECQHNILLYDINHGLQVRDFCMFLEDVEAFCGTKMITHYGGEFFAASRDNAKLFIQSACRIFERMYTERFHTRFGDEFILSLVADENKCIVRNAGAYIFRYWTRSFRLVSTAYKFNPVTVLHVPDEKSSGMIKIYEYYKKNGKLPQISKVHRLLNISHRHKKTLIRNWIKFVLKR